MRVALVGGRSRTDYLMATLAESAEEVVAINSDRAFCEYLASRHDGTVVWGDGTKREVLEEAGIAGFDVIVALTGYDADNLAVCQVANHFLGIRRLLCIVANPENVGLFRQLGVTAAISGTATLAQAIQAALNEASQEPIGTMLGQTGPMALYDDEAPTERLLGSWHLLGKGRA
ncbi:NAD-binding protein [Adlercreutzia sp. R25]|uniref:NAD-binding protein n=1 Tax=Adlercreutzia shanghongiae TaxID=3111773 RepID=A0ABU6IZ38_9ACTN|nr:MULTISPECIES: NAD-binding protein [unclassified Adlercreutzia]MEC4271954.1 NAD-binding protein [Adlercreutzia sp. R25]MEC4294935.1 NAD-binding protein [Adlercreutzia sp. R22]